MLQNDFNESVGVNLAKYRKFNGLTQIALAEKINYSDKAISKWENGECLPDVYVLKQLADLYGVTVNDLIEPKTKPKAPLSKARKFFIPALSCSLVWLVALISLFLILILAPHFKKPWIVFIFVLPITFIVTLVFSCIYKNRINQFVSISAIVWTAILSIHLGLNFIIPDIAYLYIVGIPLQVITILWYTYRFIVKRKNVK